MFGLLTTGQGRERAQHTAKGEQHEMREADGPRGVAEHPQSQAESGQKCSQTVHPMPACAGSTTALTAELKHSPHT